MNEQEGQSKLSNIKIVGFMVGNDRDKVRDIKPELLDEFDKITGKKRYAPSSFYPMEETLLHQRVACKLIFGNESPDSYHKMGVIDFKSIVQTQFGKVTVSLFAKDFRSVILNFPKVFYTVIKGVNLTSIETNKGRFRIHLDIDPYPPNYWVGFFTTLAEFFKKEVIIEQEDNGNIGRIITILEKED